MLAGRLVRARRVGKTRDWLSLSVVMCCGLSMNVSVCEGGEAVDWTFAHLELLQKQGIDLHKEMEMRSEAVTSYLCHC